MNTIYLNSDYQKVIKLCKNSIYRFVNNVNFGEIKALGFHEVNFIVDEITGERAYISDMGVQELQAFQAQIKKSTHYVEHGLIDALDDWFVSGAV